MQRIPAGATACKCMQYQGAKLSCLPRLSPPGLRSRRWFRKSSLPPGRGPPLPLSSLLSSSTLSLRLYRPNRAFRKSLYTGHPYQRGLTVMRIHASGLIQVLCVFEGKLQAVVREQVQTSHCLGNTPADRPQMHEVTVASSSACVFLVLSACCFTEVCHRTKFNLYRSAAIESSL